MDVINVITDSWVMKFGDFAVGKIHIVFFWFMMQRSLAGVYQHVGLHCPQLQGRSLQSQEYESMFQTIQ
jgi:hypothetical protein